jgi:hypothetical protein
MKYTCPAPVTRTQFIDSKQATPIPPLIHARLPVSQQWTSVIHQIYSAPPAAVVLMNSLLDWAWGKEAQFRSDVIPKVGLDAI